VNAVEADERALGASVAGEEDGASVFLSLEAASATDAKAVAELIVAGALERLGLEAEATALQAYDDEGTFIP
jgi:hypothetical protein